ncbi:MAG: hypothetical protein U0414_19765 [Polyangiaceae bacterium]
MRLLGLAIVLPCALLVGATAPARAEPVDGRASGALRLTADAWATAPDPSAFLMVQAEAQGRSPLLYDAEALVWAGVFERYAPDRQGSNEQGPIARGDVALMEAHVRDPVHWWDVRLGRILYRGGAVRPLHLDGAAMGIHTPTGATVEVFGGMPVLDDQEGRSFDWLVGVRSTQALGDLASIGYSYWQERDGGVAAHSELGVEASFTPASAFLLSSTFAIDTLELGLAEARVSALLHDRVNRLELFATRRSPSRMLDATSFFATLGSYDADQIGLSGFWRAAPRLDVSATFTLDRVADAPGATQLVRAELRLVDDGAGALGGEARRVSDPGSSWTGVRAFVRLPLPLRLHWSAEAELAFPDDPRGRGVVWPWALTALRFDATRALSLAASVEASATPSYASSVVGFFRASGTWGGAGAGAP